MTATIQRTQSNFTESYIYEGNGRPLESIQWFRVSKWLESVKKGPLCGGAFRTYIGDEFAYCPVGHACKVHDELTGENNWVQRGTKWIHLKNPFEREYDWLGISGLYTVSGTNVKTFKEFLYELVDVHQMTGAEVASIVENLLSPYLL